ncbi:hypothetical protein Sango_2867500 [Sesamum angolense]|uniref:Uncharacterized protein n=1 Tax=Sesamum angolense TaxID=2727404 RepID=A0AAE1W0E6_9LAMI|nr:hypothetical protein Sango_2867500 [Sesamum angolense]
MNRLWMAASVAVVNSHSDQGQKLKSALKSLNHAKKHFFPGNSWGHGPDAAGFRPFPAVMKSEIRGFLIGGRTEQMKPAEESLHQVMYFNCWGQS